MNYKTRVLNGIDVHVIVCEQCSMKFVLYAAIVDDEGKIKLMDQVDRFGMYCPYCGKYTNDNYNIEGVKE